WVCAVGPVGAEALDARVHQARIELLDRSVAEAQALENAGPEVLEEHIALLQQGTEDVVGPRAVEVQGQAALVAVEGQVEEAVRVGAILVSRAGRVALARLLDF